LKIIFDNIQANIVVTGYDKLTDPTLLEDLREYMSVNVPGAYFSPQYRKKQWDGVRRFITPTGRMATGFLPVLAKHLDRAYPDLDIELVDNRGEIPTFKSNLITKIGSNLAEGDYAHQKDAIASLDYWFSIRESQIAFPRGILNAATNAGKMAIIAGSYMNLEGDNRMLVTIHNKTLFDQLVQEFEEIFNGDIGIINATTYKPNIITVAMIKTLYNRIQKSNNVKKDMRMFNVVAVDECHLAGSKTYQGVLKAVHAPVRIFVSGTPFDSDAIVNKMIAIGLSGPERYKITKRELMDKGISIECKVHMHLCHEPSPVLRPGVKAMKTLEDHMYGLVIASVRRITIINDILKDFDGSTLIAVRHIEHGHLLSSSLQLMTNKPITFVHGTDPEREQKIQDFKDGKIKILISTTILKEGANIPIIGKIINAAGGKDRVALKQWMGRGERKFEGQEEFIMHDFYDIGKYVEDASKSRRAAYKKEQLEVTEHYDRKIIQNIHRNRL
jgi:superfamily II DNA or RNA helicase